MNLKLFKPDYKGDKKKTNLDYRFFGEYVKQSGNKFIFKGGFGGNTNTKVNTKLIDILEHNFQIHSIIKRFKETFGSKYSTSKETKFLNSPSFTSKKLKIVLPNDSSRIINKPNLCLSPILPSTKNCSFFQSNTNTSSLIPRLMSSNNLLSNRDEPSLSSLDQFPYLINKNCSSIQYNIIGTKSKIDHSFKKEQKYKKVIENINSSRLNCPKNNEMDDYFIKSDKNYYHERNYLFNKYKRKFDFYQSQNDKQDQFEAKRLILFKKSHEGMSYSLPKPSKHAIQLMLMKHKRR